MDNTVISLSTIVTRQKTEIGRILSAAFVDREASGRLIKILNTDSIKVITGPRRSGKSSLALQILSRTKFAYFNFEDESLPQRYNPDELIAALAEVYPDRDYLLFDEIQLMPGWERLVNRLQRTGQRILITGSNSKLLSSELASSLTGRYTEIRLLPFSYREYLIATKQEESFEVFNAYLVSGGFPTVVTGRAIGQDFLPTLWDAIVLKDMVQRYKIRRTAELRNLMHLVLSSMASRATHRSLARGTGDALTHATVGKFVAWGEGAYLCSLLNAFSFKARERVNSEKKIYLYDNGFFTAQKKSPARDLGRLLENYAFTELVRRNLTPNLDLFTYRTRSHREVDFFISAPKEPTLIQIAYSTENAETLKRELRALKEAAAELQVKKLFLLTCDDGAITHQDGALKIIQLPLWQAGSWDKILPTLRIPAQRRSTEMVYVRSAH